MPHHYRTFSSYLHEYFGVRIYRVPLDAGMTCPNRDGTRAWGGCTFCDGSGAASPEINTADSVHEQLESGIQRVRARFRAKKFLAYFQSYSNTYASEAVLHQLYNAAIEHPDVGGLIISTRPDCLPDNVLDLLADLSRRTFLYLEIGLQSACNRTLERINRQHSSDDFFDAVKRARARNLNVAAHVIFGLPGEDRSQMLDTVRQVANCQVNAIKIHQLCIYKGTAMEADYQQGQVSMLTASEYVELIVDTLEILPPEMIIMRLVAEGRKGEVIAPQWCFDKREIVSRINSELLRRGSRQGCKA